MASNDTDDTGEKTTRGVQVNGKTVGLIEVPPDADDAQLKAAVKAMPTMRGRDWSRLKTFFSRPSFVRLTFHDA